MPRLRPTEKSPSKPFHVRVVFSSLKSNAGLETWLEETGTQPGGAPWESYVDDPQAVEDVAELRTEVYWPLA